MNNTSICHKIATILFYIISVAAIGFGAMYFFRHHIMDYHVAFLGMSEDEIKSFNPKLIDLLLAMIHIMGATFITIGITGLIITYSSFRKGVKWAWYSLFVLFTLSLTPMLFITHKIASAIPDGESKPPWWLTLAMLIVMAIALILSWPKKQFNNS